MRVRRVGVEVVRGDLNTVGGVDDFQSQVARGFRKVLARQFQQHFVEMLLQELARAALGDDAAAIHDRDLIAQ